MAADLANRVQSRATVAPKSRHPEAATNGPEGAIARMEDQFALALPRGGEAAQLVRDAISVVRQNPKLAECDPDSVIGSLMTCAQLGLRPGVGALGQAHILPFWNGRNRRFEAQFIIGYQGMLELGNRSNEIDYLTAETVCENDFFEPDPMGGRHKHQYPNRGRRGPVIGYYSIFYRKDSSRGKLLYMSKEDMEDHRDNFATAKKKTGEIFGPWKDHFDAMGLKTVVRLNFKYMPKSTTIENALIADESVRLNMDPMADLNQVTELPRNEGAVPGEYTDEGEQHPEGMDPGTGALPDGPPSPEEAAAIYAAEQAGH